MAGASGIPSRIADEVHSLVRGNQARATDPLTDLVDTALAAASADARVAQRWAATIDEESATWRGAWIDLAETGRPVTFTTNLGHQHTLVLTAVGSDVIVGTTNDDRLVYVPLSNIELVLTARRYSIGSERDLEPAVSFQSLLFEAVEHRPTVRVLTLSGASINGTLSTVGVDVFTVFPADNTRATAISLARIAEVTQYARK
jgi:hypothetical protein